MMLGGSLYKWADPPFRIHRRTLIAAASTTLTGLLPTAETASQAADFDAKLTKIMVIFTTSDSDKNYDTSIPVFRILLGTCILEDGRIKRGFGHDE
jgi:hypothetical protein